MYVKHQYICRCACPYVCVYVCVFNTGTNRANVPIESREGDDQVLKDLDPSKRIPIKVNKAITTLGRKKWCTNTTTTRISDLHQHPAPETEKLKNLNKHPFIHFKELKTQVIAFHACI